MFETNDFEECWDGTNNGKELNSGVFIYKAVITLDNGEELIKSGHITIVK